MLKAALLCLLLIAIWFILCLLVARESLRAMKMVHPMSWASVSIVYAFAFYVTFTVVLLLVAITITLCLAECARRCHRG